MPKRAFWPAALIVVGLIFLASNLYMLPMEFTNLWPLIAIVAGLGGLLISDKEEWDTNRSGKKAAPKMMAAKSTKSSKTKKAKRK